MPGVQYWSWRSLTGVGEHRFASDHHQHCHRENAPIALPVVTPAFSRFVLKYSLFEPGFKKLVSQAVRVSQPVLGKAPKFVRGSSEISNTKDFPK